MKSNSDVPWFWNEAVWLPKNMSWTDFKSSGDERYPSSGDLWIPIVLSLLLMVCRRWIEIRLIYPIGLSRGMKPRPKLQDLPMPRELAVSLQRNGLVTATQVPTLAKRCDLPETVVAKWVHEVERRKRPGKLEKLGETGWRSLAYLSLFSLGIFALWDKPHFSDTRECWVGYPKHSIPMAIYWYYMIELSFYWSLLFFQFLDTRRKDFWQMLVHHVVTISLIVFSWITNFHRIGTLIMLLHDCADVFLDLAKFVKYLHMENLCQWIFGIFSVIWLYTRVYLFPTRILYSTLFEVPEIVGSIWPMYTVFNVLLSTLFVLHTFWTYLLIQALVGVATKGGVERDLRSPSDSEDEQDLKRV